MIEKYLEKLHQELYEKKLNLEQESQRLKVDLNNNIKFVETLRESLDENFESFSPRKVDEDKHIEIESLIEEQTKIYEKIEKLQIKIRDLDTKIDELDGVLKNIHQNQEPIVVPLKQDENIKNNLVLDFENILNKIEICNKLIDIDPIRCKLELQVIEENMKKIIKNLKDF